MENHVALHLYISVAPEISVPSQLYGVGPGTDVTLRCSVQACPKAINYWMKDDNDMLLTGPKHNVTEEWKSEFEVVMYLTIRDWQKADESHYSCISTNSLGKADGRIQSYSERGDISIYATFAIIILLYQQPTCPTPSKRRTTKTQRRLPLSQWITQNRGVSCSLLHKGEQQQWGWCVFVVGLSMSSSSANADHDDVVIPPHVVMLMRQGLGWNHPFMMHLCVVPFSLSAAHRPRTSLSNNPGTTQFTLVSIRVVCVYVVCALFFASLSLSLSLSLLPPLWADTISSPLSPSLLSAAPSLSPLSIPINGP